MCGIGGILRVWPPDQRDLALRTPHDQSIPEQWLDILDDAVKHRGPDGQGRFRDRALRADGCVVDVAFVHRRLSIIDHAGGHQPMVLAVPKGGLSASSGPKPTGRPIPGRLLSIEELNAHNRRILAESHAAAGTDPERALEALSSHGRIAVVFNGCIYNHRELRAELQRSGHVFSTDHSDTEVLVHGKREWGDDILGRLDGMYALCIWDSSQGSCLSARDRFGEKPMCGASISLKDSTLDVFASTAGALLRLRAALGHTRMPEPGRWPEWLTQGYASFGLAGVDEDWPCARDIWRAGEDAQTCSMFGVSHELAQGRRRTLTTSDVEALLVSAVQSRLEADVPVGCLLSGGVDSSLVASIAKHANGELRTITVRMPDARFDESSYGERVASLIGSTHTTVECDVRPADDLASLIRTIGLPFGDSSLLPTLWAHRAVGREMRVVLTGDGGDELFAGYERYRAAQVLGWGGFALRPIPIMLLHRSDPNSKSERLARLVEAARAGDARDLERIFPQSLWRRIFPRQRSLDTRRWIAGRLSARALIDFDLWMYLPFDLMRKSDSASMQVPVESRSPMLANDISIAAMNAPISCLMPHGQRKGLLRAVARKYLPAEIVDRPKMGFAIPIGEWFRSDYGGLRTMLLDHLNSTEPFGPPSLGIDLNMKFIRQMLDEHLGTGPSGRVVRDHSQRLYMLLVLSIWAKWLGGLGKSA